MTKKMRFIKAREDEWPTCPWCKKELNDLKYKDRGFLKNVTVYWCPHCGHLLGTSATFNA